jgi:hypothetical protein
MTLFFRLTRVGLLLLGSMTAGHAQFVQPCIALNPQQPAAESCAEACVYCDFDAVLAGNNYGAAPGSPAVYCDGALAVDNDVWYGFVAGSTQLGFEITAINCFNNRGLQAAVFSSCSEPALVCHTGHPTDGYAPLLLAYDSFVPGRTYYLMVDGYLGDQCSFSLQLTDGSVQAPPVGQVEPPAGPGQASPA